MRLTNFCFTLAEMSASVDSGSFLLTDSGVLFNTNQIATVQDVTDNIKVATLEPPDDRCPGWDELVALPTASVSASNPVYCHAYNEDIGHPSVFIQAVATYIVATDVTVHYSVHTSKPPSIFKSYAVTRIIPSGSISSLGLKVAFGGIASNETFYGANVTSFSPTTDGNGKTLIDGGLI